ncbi:DUF3857 domain-containing protein [Pedobacter montanisoli]|uniref:DUF3857 and transglutaminase domain-containing protein n=1 Tax=Pedobacter montanisoli TaxID=2923277 RepID=A0ABS9ZZ20_9SPHI|nr:DUF3857 domain-containing protein [Pedobacter montanisoli]MCJ0743549.1 DUF3857 and transglutaminase domain-containing protein [Pedobacter montanisoli]
MYKILIIACVFFSFGAYAQDFSYGDIEDSEQSFSKSTLDSNANAIYLNEYGTSRFIFDSQTGNMKLVHDYHARIKIFNKDGAKSADIVVPLYRYGTGNDQQEYISNLTASTFNYANGSYNESVLNKNNIFRENKNKYVTLVKFTLPNIKDNSIIEYKYTIESPYLFNYRTWEFQTDIPKLKSTYIAYIPSNYNYNVTLRGFYKLSDSKAEISRECLRVSGVDMDCSKLTYTMNYIPAFIEEEYMTSAANYKSAIYFELAEVFYLNGSRKKYTSTWKDVEMQLVDDKNFGGHLKRKDVFKDIVPNITKDASTELEKAKAIFDYIKKQIKWNNIYSKYGDESIKSVLESRSGNSAEINLSLIAALSAANIDVEAVILSTRDNGMVSKINPVISEFNYVIAKANIDGESYLLDATEPLIQFGLLPLRCVNDQGRVINLKKPSYWIDLKANKKSTSVHFFNGKLGKDGKITGKLTSSSNGYDALSTRKNIKKYSSLDEYVEKLEEKLSGIKIKDFSIKNIDSIDLLMEEEYQLEFTVQNMQNADQSYFSPFFINPIKKNPFKLKERNYPVDLGAQYEERTTINLELPENYKVKETPKEIAVSLPNNGGRYLLQTTVNDGSMMISQVFTLNKPIYSAEEYFALKEFYNRIIQAQKTEILLTKAK